MRDLKRSNLSGQSGWSGGCWITRRSFIKTAAAAAATAGPTLLSTAGSSSSAPRAHSLADCNITLSRWPFRRLPLDETPKLVAKLRTQSVTQAWAANFDAILHKDLGSANFRLFRECRQNGGWGKPHPFLIPFGTVNPKLPDWQEELRRCHEQYNMPGLRLYPNYHGYTLESALFSQLADAAASRGLIFQIALSVEDERMQHPLLRVPNTDPASLPSVLREHSTLKIVLLNWFRAAKPDVLKELAATRRIWFDIAMVEGVGGISNILEHVPADRVLFGSHAPFYYFESAALKLQESSLTADQLRQISWANARSLL